MQAAKGFVCYECGCEVPMDRETCQRCRTDLRERIAKKTIKLAYDIAPRRVRFVNAKMPGNSRPEEMVRLLEESGVDLASSKLLIDVGAGPNLVRHVTPAKYPKLKVVGYDQYTLEGAEWIDLENAKLPYSDAEVDVAVCSHVLEHIDNNHALADEICRVARNVVILLPNSILWTAVAKVVLQRTLLPMVGLPLEKPADRHRWIYTVREATRWARHLAGKWDRNLDILYRTDWRLPTIMGRINPDLFVLEMSYVLTPR